MAKLNFSVPTWPNFLPFELLLCELESFDGLDGNFATALFELD
jgi:hypothetical protein